MSALPIRVLHCWRNCQRHAAVENNRRKSSHPVPFHQLPHCNMFACTNRPWLCQSTVQVTPHEGIGACRVCRGLKALSCCPPPLIPWQGQPCISQSHYLNVPAGAFSCAVGSCHRDRRGCRAPSGSLLLLLLLTLLFLTPSGKCNQCIHSPVEIFR